MRTVRRLLYREILGATLYVALAFLALFFFIDLVGEIDALGRPGITIGYVFWVSLLQIPGHVYELSPIAVLIGAIYALARLAQSSEFTILRTGGLGPWRALALLGTLGVALTVFTFVVGDFVAPWGDTRANLLRSVTSGGLNVGRTGAWLRDSRDTPAGPRLYTVNVGVARSHGEVEQVRIFEFDGKGTLLTRIEAKSASIDDNGLWHLRDARRSHWPNGPTAQPLPPDEALATLDWPSRLTRSVVGAAILPLRTMSTMDLYTYMTHLSKHEQAGQRYEIQFWRKALYPFACIVMLALALPFAYLHSRRGGVTLKVFGGIMLGISFVVLNAVSGHLGLLRDWTPWIAASVPSVVYLLLSMAAFTWLVRYR
jgi:lipopolysaccharide export system permease protein